MEEGELASFRELLKEKVYDAEGLHIGHVQDLAIDDDLSSPYVAYLGVHMHWTDRVGEFELVRPVEDIVLLLPWSQVQYIEEDGYHLYGVHPDFPIQTARGKFLLRRDILNKQMLDQKGNRIQRVDDVLLEREGKTLKIVGLQISLGWLPASSGLQQFIDRLKKKFSSAHEVEMIPWEAVFRIDDEAIIVGEASGENVQ